MRNSQFGRALERGGEIARGAAGPAQLHPLQSRVDLRDQLVRPVWFADESGQPSREHAVYAVLSLGEETGAEHDNGIGFNGPEPPKRFFAIHEWHREVEHDEIEPVRSIPDLLEAFETGLDGRDLETGFGKNTVGQNARGRIVIDYQNPAGGSRQGVARGFGLGSLIWILVHHEALRITDGI